MLIQPGNAVDARGAGHAVIVDDFQMKGLGLHRFTFWGEQKGLISPAPVFRRFNMDASY